MIAYQTGIDPTKIAQAKGEYEKDSGRDIQWKNLIQEQMLSML